MALTSNGLTKMKPAGCMVIPEDANPLPPLPMPKFIYPHGVFIGDKGYSRKEYAMELIKQQAYYG